MAYAVGGLIQASDYNGFIGTLNPSWSTGASDNGYGQAQFTPVAVGDIIRARPATIVPGASGTTPTWSATPEWRALVDTINNMNAHQVGGALISAVNFPGSASLPVVATSTTGLIAWGTTVAGAITTVTSTQRLNAVAQGADVTNVATSGVTWSDSLTTTFTIAFGSHDNARFYFNAGGQFSVQCSHPAGAVFDIDQLISDLCSDAGTIWFSSTNGTPATVTLAGTAFNGVTKVGGANPGGVITLLQNNGFYAFGGGLTSCFRQTPDFYYFPYNGTYLDISVSYNGAGTITVVVLIDELPNGAVVSTGTVCTLTMRYPSNAILADTWGSAGLSNTIVGV